MPLAEYVMAAGSWSVTLDPGTPRAIREAINVESAGFSQLIVTPVQVNHLSFTDAGMRAIARYAGIYRAQSDSGLTLGGAGMNVIMGDEEGKGNIIESAISTSNGWLSQWFTALTGGTSGVSAGTLVAPGGSYTGSKWNHLKTFRGAWDILCQRFGVEYRVNPSTTLDVGPVSDLYGSVPAAIVQGPSAPVGAGRDVGLRGVDGSFNLDMDLEDYSAKVLYNTGTEDEPNLTVVGGNSPTYRHPNGNTLIMERLINASNDDSGSPSTMATAQLGRFNRPRLAWDIEVAGEADLGRISPVGSYIWLYDPATGLVDDANTVTFRGAQLQPVRSRLMGIETPIRPEYGVYLRTMVNASTPRYTDLTRYVVPETGSQKLTLGSMPRSSRA